MALWKAKDQDTVTLTTSGAVAVDAGKLLGSEKVRNDLAEIERLYKKLENTEGQEVKKVPVPR